jgi:hypothetical protein
MGDAVADKYEWACSLAKKAMSAEQNSDYFYAAYLYGNGARVLQTLAGASPDHKLAGVLKKKADELARNAQRLESLVEEQEVKKAERTAPTPQVPELNEQARADANEATDPTPTMATSLFDFPDSGGDGDAGGMLHFRKGDKINVLWKNPAGGWSRGEFNGIQGMFPTDFVAFSGGQGDARFRGNWQPSVKNANARSFLPPAVESAIPPKASWPEQQPPQQPPQKKAQEETLAASEPVPEEVLYQSALYQSMPLPLPPSEQEELAEKNREKEGESRADTTVVEVEVTEELLMGPQYRPYLSAIRERRQQQEQQQEQQQHEADMDFGWDELRMVRYTPVQLSKGETTPSFGAFGERGYALRPAIDAAASAARVRTMVCVTVYNEGGDELKRTLEGIALNLRTMSKRGMRGPAAWQEFLVCIVIDGKNSASESLLQYAKTGLGVFDAETMEIVGLGLGPVQMHLFELTTVLQLGAGNGSGDSSIGPSDSSIGPSEVPPLRLIFAMKENNAGKLDSHSWFFNAFVEYVYTKPNSGSSGDREPAAAVNEYCGGVEYCVLLDVGTVPAPTAIFRLQRSLDRDPTMGGVCGEISPMNPDLLNPVVASQVRAMQSPLSPPHPPSFCLFPPLISNPLAPFCPGVRVQSLQRARSCHGFGIRFHRRASWGILRLPLPRDPRRIPWRR